MKIIIATGIYPPKIGGPATYAKGLEKALQSAGHEVRIMTYRLEDHLPIGIRHLFFFFRMLIVLSGVDLLVSLDTWSVGAPATFAARLRGVRSVVRVGGDFLWEGYVNRRKLSLPLPYFYSSRPELTFKEKIIFSCTRILLRMVDTVVFTSPWLRDIWFHPYQLQLERTAIIANCSITQTESSGEARPRSFFWAGRPIFLKNLDRFQEAIGLAQKSYSDITFQMMTESTHEAVLGTIKTSAVIAVPSLSEVTPNLALEAIRFGKPFLLTENNGLHDTLRGCAVFIDPLSVADMAKKITELCDANRYRDQKEKVLQCTLGHSYDDIAQEFLAIASQ